MDDKKDEIGAELRDRFPDLGEEAVEEWANIRLEYDELTCKFWIAFPTLTDNMYCFGIVAYDELD